MTYIEWLEEARAKVLELRNEGVTYEALEVQTKIAQRTLRRIGYDKIHVFGRDSIWEISRAFDISLPSEESRVSTRSYVHGTEELIRRTCLNCGAEVFVKNKNTWKTFCHTNCRKAWTKRQEEEKRRTDMVTNLLYDVSLLREAIAYGGVAGDDVILGLGF